MAPPSNEIPEEDVDKGVKPELYGIISQTQCFTLFCRIHFNSYFPVGGRH